MKLTLPIGSHSSWDIFDSLFGMSAINDKSHKMAIYSKQNNCDP